ncbi:MAG: HpsJ family protein [Pegethrix bostrychoides GSE-TBD4-15B]|jgi:outer membrane murein-binding lipoprotein Lpp|uniref:HpsJ family protein n=1 Tax=Pegethrix bostrychoides GSE-TBD4-15B TaxID=2839662 RepID=A0A951PBJ4_9CYAN|nr:HpsJ family protein [Pegethrix bostrychoides GSE-TBD4-15B]
MKTSSLFTQPYNALILKAVGVVLIIGTLLDYLVMLVPPNFLDSTWLAALIKEYVSRGTVPLLGIAVLFLGVWLDRDPDAVGTDRPLPTAAFLLSALLGLLFLVMAPLYFNSSRLTSAAQTRQINEQAAQAQRQLNSLIDQQQQRVSSIISNKTQLAQLEQQLDSLELPADQQAQLQQIKTTLEQVKSDPKALEQEAAKARTEGLQQIETRQKEALTQLQSGLKRDRIYTTLASLLFAAGYAAIAWTGLGGAQTGTVRKRKAKTLKPNRAKKQR